MSEASEVRDLPRPIDARAALAEALEKMKLVGGDCALIGGVALAFYGIERFTKAVELAVTVAQASAAVEKLADLDPRPLRVGGVSIRTSSGVRVDLIDRRGSSRTSGPRALYGKQAI